MGGECSFKSFSELGKEIKQCPEGGKEVRGHFLRKGERMKLEQEQKLQGDRRRGRFERKNPQDVVIKSMGGSS